MKYLEDEETAKDAVMQIFENLFSGLMKHEIRSFKPWLHTVVKNHCLYKLRSQRHLRQAEDGLKKDLEHDMESGYVMHLEDDGEHQLKDLEDAILMLSREQRLCIELFYLKKKPYREIVEITGNTFEQVKSHIQNGKRNLKILLSNRNEQ
jgi:RNA polymerase sigma-70 factor (ECF subfamily)